MRMLWTVVVLVAVGAVESGCWKRRISVAATPEGNECKRQCMVVFSSCMGGRGGGKHVCRNQENECLATCPGAVLP